MLACALASGARAQIVSGVLVSAADSQPIPYGTIIGADSVGRFADATGHFSLGDRRDGTYHVRARMLGYAPLDTTITLGSSRALLVLRLQPIAFRLATVPVVARRGRGCVVTGIPSPTINPQLAAIFDELKDNIERYTILLDQYPFHYRRVERHVVQTYGEADSLVAVDTAMYDSRVRRPYQIGSIVYPDVTRGGTKRVMMYLPTFADLGDPKFDAAHCFSYRGSTNGELRIDFQPADTIKVPDVEGSVYLDAERYLVRRAVFRLTKPSLASKVISGLTTTSTFEEVLPLVPILATARAEQPLFASRDAGVDPHTSGRYPSSFDPHSLRPRTAVEKDSMLDHTFLTDVAALPAPPVVEEVSVSCAASPSFETTEVPIYGIVGGAKPGNPNNDRLTLAIRRQFHLPENLNPPVYGFEMNSKVAPTLTGQVTFRLNRQGRLDSLALTATSLLPEVDRAFVDAVRRADSLKSFVGVPAGRYTVSLSSAKPDADALAVEMAHLDAAVLPLTRKAAIAVPVPPVAGGSGTFEFVIDERGRVMPATVLAVQASSDAFATAFENGLDTLRFTPATAGGCPIKQVVQFRTAR